MAKAMNNKHQELYNFAGGNSYINIVSPMRHIESQL